MTQAGPVPLPLFPDRAEPFYAGRGRRPRAQAAVLYAVRARSQPSGAEELAGTLGRSPSSVRRCLRLLVIAGLVLTVESSRRGRRWVGSAARTCTVDGA